MADLADLAESTDLTDHADTTTSPQQTTIAGGAELCLRAFQQCLHLSASYHPRELASVEDQLARFSIWTSSIGVFSRGRASMDHRLREAPDVHHAVSSLLDTLVDSIQNCSTILEDITESRRQNSKGSPTNIPNSDLDYSVRAVAKEISLLYRLSNTIRRASKETQNLKVAKLYHIRDDDGNDAEPLLKELYANYICGRFPSMQDNLQQRLASSMVLRRKRILYRRSRYGASPIRPSKTISQPKIEFPKAQNHATDTTDLVEDLAEGPAAMSLTDTKSIVQSLAPSATTLAADAYKRVSTPSVVSAAKTVALSNHEDLVFPSAPNGRVKQKYRILKKQREEAHKAHLKTIPGFSVPGPELAEVRLKISEAEARLQTCLELDWNECNKAVAEVICPFCLYALPSLSVSDERKWKSHVTKDLDAYVCLFDECDKPEELYSHSSDWLRHMREHTLRWRCSSKAHRSLVFLTEEEYLGHMRANHPGAFTEPQLRVLAERNGRPTVPMFESCPICGVDKTTVRFEDHIVGHLRFLALRSLPAHEDGGSESSEGEKGSLGTSKPASRITIKMDPERHIKPTFEDFGEISTWNLDGEAAASQLVYEPWGGYRKYIALYRKYIATHSANRFAEQNRGIVLAHTDHFPPPHAFDGEEDSRFLWHMDPSRNFVEESLFAGVPKEDHRRFEWGAVTQANDGQLESLHEDRVIQSILRYKLEKLDPSLVAPDNDDSPLATHGSSDVPAKPNLADNGAPSDSQVPSQESEPPKTTEEMTAEEDRGRSEGSTTETNSRVVSGSGNGKEKEDSSTAAPDNDRIASGESDDNKKRPRGAEDMSVPDISMLLAQALSGQKQPDTTPLIEILPGLTHQQVMELRVEYKKIVKAGSERKGVNVAKHIRVRLQDQGILLMKACYSVALGRWESEAYWANLWYQSDKNRRELLIESLMGRTNHEIHMIKEAFSDKKYDNSLSKCMKAELKDDIFRKAILMVLEECRMEEEDKYGHQMNIDYDLVDRDVAELRHAMESYKGGETTMITIILQRSDSHIREICKAYQRDYLSDFAVDIIEKSRGTSIGEVLEYILLGVENRPSRDAMLLRDAINDSHPNSGRDELLISRLVRYHWDPQHMRAIKQTYADFYKMQLSDAVRERTSGKWGQFCFELCIDRTPADVNRVEADVKISQ